MVNDLRLVRSVVCDLDGAGLSALVFGGWADELNGVTPPRAHRDIDLLVLDPDDAVLNGFLRSTVEVMAKRSSHKRAFVTDDVLIELFIAHKLGDTYVTRFWDQLVWGWPSDLSVNIDGLQVATAAAVTSYRENWAGIHAYGPAHGPAPRMSDPELDGQRDVVAAEPGGFEHT